jgi:hypothetical protein
MPTVTRRVRILLIAALLAVAVVALLVFPGRESSLTYPFVDIAPHGVRSPLWRMSGAAFERLAADDTARLARFAAALDAGVRRAEASRALFAAERADDVTAADRERIRQIWYGVLEPMVALESLKARWAPWWGIDYRRHPERHARAYAIAFGALLAEVGAGLRFVALTQGHAVAETLLDEPVPGLTLPARTYTGFKYEVLHVKRYAEVVTGFDWYRVWLARYLKRGSERALDGFVRARQADAARRIAKTGARDLAKNAADLVRDHTFEGWFPVQKSVAEWMGDTRFVPQERRLVKDEHLAKALALLRPGDILLERRNWYLSNVGLPGFWPHAALYFGTPQEVASYLGGDLFVRRDLGHLPGAWETKYPDALRAWAGTDDAGHAHRVLEAVSEGVVFQSFEHSCGADYIAALRPRLPRLHIAHALERALQLHGLPYDFDFDFTSDSSVVCSELVEKAYDQPGGLRGLVFPFVDTIGRRTLPPTEIVRTFARQRGGDNPQLDFVFFFDGREARHAAVEANADDLAASCERAKWDLAQP